MSLGKEILELIVAVHAADLRAEDPEEANAMIEDAVKAIDEAEKAEVERRSSVSD